MLKLEIGREVVVEENRKVRFAVDVEFVLELEHSLTSLSKWEEIWEKPFLDGKKNSFEETISYIECMVVTPNPPPGWTSKLRQANIDEVDKYINAKMTATWFNEQNQAPKRSTETITAELIYYWLSNLPSMPPNFEHWHLNKLFTFIKIHDVKNQKPKKLSTTEAAAQRRQAMAERRAQYASGSR
jgi:hypothetical protein